MLHMLLVFESLVCRIRGFDNKIHYKKGSYHRPQTCDKNLFIFGSEGQVSPINSKRKPYRVL